VKRAAIKALPHMLCIHLKRFEFDYHNQTRYKVRAGMRCVCSATCIFQIGVGGCVRCTAELFWVGVCWGGSTRQVCVLLRSWKPVLCWLHTGLGYSSKPRLGTTANPCTSHTWHSYMQAAVYC
jgi:hypothetical protein